MCNDAVNGKARPNNKLNRVFKIVPLKIKGLIDIRYSQCGNIPGKTVLPSVRENHHGANAKSGIVKQYVRHDICVNQSFHRKCLASLSLWDLLNGNVVLARQYSRELARDRGAAFRQAPFCKASLWRIARLGFSSGFAKGITFSSTQAFPASISKETPKSRCNCRLSVIPTVCA